MLMRWMESIEQSFRGLCLYGEPMTRHTSFRIGGPADLYLYPKDMEDLSFLLRSVSAGEVPLFIIGSGTNVLVSDEGFRGVVVDLTRTFGEIRTEDVMLEAGAGVSLASCIEAGRRAGLGGLENLTGIPGTVGGGVRTNAGAFGVELLGRTRTIRILHNNGESEEVSGESISFGYRSGYAPTAAVVTGVVFELDAVPHEQIQERIQTIKRIRREKQPVTEASAGSVFKRPKGYFSGKLIEDAGCKGMRAGDAVVSPKHAGFIVNNGHATADDVRRLMDLVQRRVNSRFGIWLEPEIELVGF